MQNNALHTQLACSAHRLFPFGKASFGYRSDACILPAKSAASIIATWRSATPFSSGVSTVVSSCLIFSRVHREPNSHSNYPTTHRSHQFYFAWHGGYQVLHIVLGGVLTVEKIHLGKPRIFVPDNHHALLSPSELYTLVSVQVCPPLNILTLPPQVLLLWWSCTA